MHSGDSDQARLIRGKGQSQMDQYFEYHPKVFFWFCFPVDSVPLKIFEQYHLTNQKCAFFFSFKDTPAIVYRMVCRSMKEEKAGRWGYGNDLIRFHESLNQGSGPRNGEGRFKLDFIRSTHVIDEVLREIIWNHRVNKCNQNSHIMLFCIYCRTPARHDSIHHTFSSTCHYHNN